MLKAPLPNNEKERLATLKDYKVLDTLQEEQLDQITETAALLCDCPISLVSLIDSKRQWFKSKHGLDAEETPRDVSYCGHAIMGDDLFIIEDAELDDRFCDNPLFTGEPYVRFYAGHPLIAPNGHRIGTLCVIDSKSKKLNEVQKKLLKTLASQVINFLELKKKHYELIESEENRLKILNNMNDGLVVQNTKGEIIDFNPAALRILSLTEDQLIGRTSADPQWRAIKEDGSPFNEDEHPAMITLKTGESVQNKIMGIDAPGNGLRWIRINSFSVEDKGGRQAVTTFQNITELESTKRELSLLYANSPFGFAFCEMDGTLIDVNSKYEEITGYTYEELKNLSYWDITPKKYEADEAKQLESLEKNGRYGPYRKEYRQKNGELIPVELNGFIVEDFGGKKGIWSIIENISEKVKQEKELLKQKSIANHNARLASLGELAAGVGHEINNPLSIIAGSLYFIETNLADAIKEKKQEKFIQNLHIANKRIQNIVQGLRTFSRSDSSEVSQFSVTESIQESYQLVKEIYQKEGISLKFANESSSDLTIEGNRGKFQQIFMNLLINAKDATLGKDKREISVQVKKDQDQVVLTIQDNGHGIPDDIKEKIFDPFFTTKDVNQGTGIGLSLVHNFIQELNGKVKIEDSSEQGTIFKLELPLVEKQTNSDVNEAHKKNNQKKNHDYNGRILLADDEEAIRTLLATILKDIGFQVDAVENGAQAYELYISNPGDYDLIISDMKMPDMDGISLLKAIKEKSELPQPKFVCFTGGVNFDFEDSQNEVNKLIDGYFYKPFSREKILEVLSSCLELESKDK